MRTSCSAAGAGGRCSLIWPDWMNPGGKDATTITGAAVASTVQASAERPWFTDPLALLASVARAADQWEPPALPGDQAELLRPLAETVASAPAASWWREPTDLRYQCWLGAGAATLLAGWDADQTLWLRDVFTGIRQLTTWHGTPGPGALDDDGASTT